MTQEANIQFRQNTKAGAEASNPILAAGEPGFETDTNKFKIGDGGTEWNDLKYSGQTGIVENVEHITTQIKDFHSLDQSISYTHDEERRFFKDDFSVDSLPFYDNVVANSKNYFTITGGELVFNTNGESVQPEIVSQFAGCKYGEYELVFKVNDPEIDTKKLISILIAVNGVNYWGILISREVGGTTTRGYLHKNNVITSGGIILYNGININDGNYHTLKVVWTTAGITFYLDGSLGNTYAPTTKNYPSISDAKIGVGSPYTNYPCNANIASITYRPSISYSDNFATDTVSGTNGRYQAVTGTVAYDGTNKRMNVTTATGANGKASGRLKSYKFTEGSQIFDVTLPTGADGDFICLATHSANGLMTDGIGVGLQSDGAGNWNLATLSGTTVTEGADSGLDDADVARIEIEKDLSGAYWYYIYNAAGTKPTTATGKLFTTLTEGYTGWYANGAGATTQTFAIDNISIRAESIVGRTNVQVEEPFWFRDEFSENSLGRYAQSGSSGSWTYNSDNGRLRLTTTNNTGKNLIVAGLIKNTSVSVDLYPVLSTNNSVGGILLTTSSPGNGYPSMDGSYAKVEFGLDDLIQLKLSCDIKKLNSKTTSITRTWMYGEKFTLTLSDNGVEVRAKVYDSAGNLLAENFSNTIIPNCNCVSLTGYPLGSTESRIMDYDNLQISGTRVYNKPIHRGAMLETYFDGTQEVVGTTFVDDCQWDRSAEYTSSGTVTRDTTNGKITISSTGGYSKINTLDCEDGFYEFVFSINHLTTSRPFIQMCGDTTDISFTTGNKIVIFAYDTYIRVFKVINGDSSSAITILPSGLTINTQYRVGVLKVGDTAYAYLNGQYVSSLSGVSGLQGNVLVGCFNGNSGVNIHNITVIAASPDVTNGIAACIPPIGGGARYDTQESITQTIDMSGIVSSDLKAYSSAISTNAAETALLRITAKNDTDDTSVYSDGTTKYWDVVMDGTVINTRKALETNFNDKDDSIVLTHSTDSGVPDGCIYVRETICKPITIVTEEDLT